MSNTCTHCSRVNPPGAEYCYFDGSSLNRQDGPQNIGSRPFPAPFVFPGGRACRSFDQLAVACQEDWPAAVDLLRDGAFERFLGGLGRIDLALAARHAADFPDADRGLDQLLERLPTQALPEPKLQTELEDLDLGTLRPDTDHRFAIRLANLGARLLYGSIASDTKWLTLGDGPGSPRKLFQCGSETAVPLTVHSRQLRAGNKPMEAKLVIESNGGTATVRVRALVQAQPFSDGLLAGALTPRQLAEKARKSPKEAAAYFESGAVARWYQENGWTYPVQGPAAKGLAAVQQFFEALGLAKPPKVEVTEPVLSLRGRPGESVRQTVQVRTSEKRPVFASAASDQAWLSVGTAQLNGAVATIPLEVGRVPDQPGEVLQARVAVTANGGQRFVVSVSLAVAPAAPAVAEPTAVAVDTAESPAAPPRARPLTPPRTPVKKRVRRVPDEREGPDEPGRGNATLYIALGGVALLLLLVGGVALLFLGGDGEAGEPRGGKVAVAIQNEPGEQKNPAKGPAVPAQPLVDIKDEPEEVSAPQALPVKFKIDDEPEERTGEVKLPPAQVTIKDEPEEVQPGAALNSTIPLDPKPRLIYKYGPNSRFGITAVADRQGRPLGKRLTYSDPGVAPDGGTSNTLVKVNGALHEFGENSFDKEARWLVRHKRLPDDPVRQSRNGTVSVLAVGKIRISQVVEVVPSTQPVLVRGAKKRVLDTVLVRYVIENLDSRAHLVSMRVMIDTQIGDNDGVPFTVPGYGGLVDSMADFRTPEQVPVFIQALERPNLRAPGTVALMTLKPGGGLEPPGRVSLTHWPGPNITWDVPIVNMRLTLATASGNDSAVVLYWGDKALPPGQKRVLGYAYGLGQVDASEAGGKLGITLNGDFSPGKYFSVTALLTNPQPGQTVTLEAPGFEIQGQPKASVPPAQGKPPTSVVTWYVKVLKPGEFRVRVVSSTGQAQAKTISIVQPKAPAGGKLALDIQGQRFDPGQTFTLLAKVAAPLPGQKLTLQLPPRGLECVEGALTQDVPAADGPQGTSTVAWKVKVVVTGRFPLRVESSTGVAQTKTLTIVQQDTGGGVFRVALEGKFAPGADFHVIASVADPVEGQTLTLKLPPGLERQSGADVQAVPSAPKGGSSQVRWGVRVQKAGRFTLAVASSTGVTKKTTLTIEGADPNAGKFALSLSGDIKPGKVFYVAARVTSPLKGQTLKLKLSTDTLERAEGAEEQPVPASGEVRWGVRVSAAEGELRVRVESPATGVTQGKRITLKQAPPEAGKIFGN
jgi:hypothetical protein